MLEVLELVVVFAAVDQGQYLFDFLSSLFGLDHDFVDPEESIQVEHLFLLPVDVFQQDHRHHLQSFNCSLDIIFNISFSLEQEPDHEDLYE